MSRTQVWFWVISLGSVLLLGSAYVLGMGAGRVDGRMEGFWQGLRHGQDFGAILDNIVDSATCEEFDEWILVGDHEDSVYFELQTRFYIDLWYTDPITKATRLVILTKGRKEDTVRWQK